MPGDDLLHQRAQAHALFSEHWLTACHPDPAEAFGAVGARLAAEGIAPLQEKVHGLAAAREGILAARRARYAAAGLPADWPVTYVEAAPVAGGDLAGVQVWGARGADGAVRVRTVSGHGRLLTGAGVRLLHLAQVDGLHAGPPDDEPRAGDQAARMFTAASERLAAHDFRYDQVVRTWIYFPRLLAGYGEFNRVRTAHHRREGLRPDDAHPALPASTGIQGGSGGRECFMDVLAVAGDGGALERRAVHASARQGPATAYGSGFARAAVLDRGGARVIHVSGTASIGPDGATLHAGDAGAQYVETLLCLASLLEEQGATLADVCSGTLFAKTPAAWSACREVERLLGLPRLPLVRVLADVCRPDLLVEVEAVALAGGRRETARTR